MITALLLVLPIYYNSAKTMPIMNVEHVGTLAAPMRMAEPFALLATDYCSMTPDDFPPPLPVCEYQVNIECYLSCVDTYNFTIAANISAACQAYNDAEGEFDDCYEDAGEDWALCCLMCFPFNMDCYSKCAIQEINDKKKCDRNFVAKTTTIKTKFETDNAAATAAAVACMAQCCITIGGN